MPTMEEPVILPLPPATPMAWLPAEQALPVHVADARPETYHLLRTGADQDPADFGLAWPQPVEVGTFVVSFATLGGRAFEPDPRAVTVQVWRDGQWRPVLADLTIDRTHAGSLAPAQGRGWTTWTFRFRPIATQRVRVVAQAPAHRDLGYQSIALAEMHAAREGTSAPTGTVHHAGPTDDPPPFLRVGANLAVPEAGATIVPGNPWKVTWLRPVLVNTVRAPAGTRIAAVAWSYEGTPRSVERLSIEPQNVAQFAPACVKSLEITFRGRPPQRVSVECGPEVADYFEAVRLARTDMLGERFRAASPRDLATMQSLMLPIDFSKVPIGRPADLVETLVTWSGTFFQTFVAPCRDSQTGATLPAQMLERWFALLPGGRLPDYFRTNAAWLDGWLPATVHTHHGPLRITQTVFVTAPDAPVYGTVALVTVHNDTHQRRRWNVELAMGVRRLYGDPGGPFIADPLQAEYSLDADRRTVRNSAGEIVLFAHQPAAWGGTPREPHLKWQGVLEPGQTATLTFVSPDVTAPLRDSSVLRRLDPHAELSRFRRYWTDLLGPAARIALPEPALANALRNLLCQCLIAGLDGPVARYGAYHYEAYFGLEEGWIAVALAQFGLAQYARAVMDYMLSDECLDKSNYHHQYRNGLAAWYAADVARLCPDEAWLRKIAPTLKRCADWTIEKTHENQDAKWGGILPRHAYGGDIGMPAYSFYANATCWRGLHDTAVLLRTLGDEDTARRYEQAADAYRKRLIQLADALCDRSSGAPFLPMSFGLIENGREREKEPSYAMLAQDVPYSDLWTYLGNYWNLFAPCFQELRLFPVGDERAHWIPHYMERHGGICAGQVRFANGLDAVYGKGYIQSLLDSGRRDEFLTSLFGLFGHAMSRNLFSNPEVSGIFPLRTSNLAMWREHARERWFWLYRYGGAWAQGWQNQEGEPLAAGSGMAIQLLRMAIVREDYAQDPPTALRLLDGIPATWTEEGKRIRCPSLHTFFGRLTIDADGLKRGVRVRLRFDQGFSAQRVVLRIPAPDGVPLREVRVNGQLHAPSANEVTLDTPRGDVTVEAHW